MVEVPGTLEGWYVLHDFRSVDWSAWTAAPAEERRAALAELEAFTSDAEAHGGSDEGSSGLYSVVGHKADLLFLHLRPTPEELNELETRFARTRFAAFTSRPYSYVSVTELSLYEAQSRGALENPMEVPFVRRRLKFEVPDHRYVTFYPMNKRRGEHENWFTLPMETRREMMRSHGSIGHKYHGVVQQMISGSVGLDDWEWGVTLFSHDALQFKKLVYEMRFDEVSARYAEFGPFYLGIRLPVAELRSVLAP